GLSTNNVAYFNTNDFLRGRLRHWLGATVEGDAWRMDTISVEREPSQDGTTPGQLLWYDYKNKAGPGGPGTDDLQDQGDHVLPAVTARVLPDGSTSYTWFRRNSWYWPTNIVSTYSRSDGTIGL